MHFRKLNIYEYHKLNNKVDYLLQAQEYEKKIIFSSNEELSKFVEFAGNNYMYKSIQLLSQYHFKPNATAMTTYEEWNKMSRTIQRGRKHTPTLIQKENGQYVVEKVFDLSDVVKIDIGELEFERWEYDEKYLEKSYIKELVEKELSKLDNSRENMAIQYFVYRFVDARTDLKYLREFDDYKNLLDNIPIKYVRDNFLEVIDKSLEISSKVLDDINIIIDNYKNKEIENQLVDDKELVTNIENIFEDNVNVEKVNKIDVLKKYEYISLKLRLSEILSHSNYTINDFNDEQLEQILLAIENPEFSMYSINEISVPSFPAWKIESLRWLIEDWYKDNPGVTEEKIKYLKELDVNIFKFNIIKSYLVNDYISVTELKENQEDIIKLTNSDFLDKLKNISSLEKTDNKDVEVSFEDIIETETKEDDKLILTNDIKDEQTEIVEINNVQGEFLFEDDIEEILENNEITLDLSVGTIVYMNNEDYKIRNELVFNEYTEKYEIQLEPVGSYNYKLPILSFKNGRELLEIISFDRPKILSGDKIKYKDSEYIITTFSSNLHKSGKVDRTVRIFNANESHNIKFKDEKELEKLFGLDDNIESKEVRNNEDVNEKQNEVKNFKITDEIQADKLKPSERLTNNLKAIKLLKDLEKDGRVLTELEQKTLANYVGWGGLSDVFDDSKKGQWEIAREELKELLTEEEYRQASESTLTAFYTPKYVIDGIYKALENFGFSGGKILEPSCAIGNFIGNVPGSMTNSKFYGVELDSISGKIAHKLYPEANIKIGGYEDSNYKNNTFDVAIGNIPFGNYKVFDKEYNNKNLFIHDYFFAKTIDKVRPGGIISFITSTGTLDKKNDEFRNYIAERCDLIGAIRLPSGVFKGVAGTEVASDVIFLQKKEKLEISEEVNWLKSTNILKDGNKIYNTYFADNPEKMLAEVKSGGYLGGNEYVFKNYGDNDSLEEFKKEYINQINTLTANYKEVSRDNATISLGIDIDLYKNYSFFNYEGNIYYNYDNNLVIPNFTEKEKEKVAHYIELDNSLKEVIDIQKENCSDEELIKAQENLKTVYNSFVDKYGYINSKAVERFFKEDSNYFLLSTLEKVDDRDRYKVVALSDIFNKRTIRSDIEILSADNVKDALVLSLNNYAGVNLPYICKLTDKNINAVIDELKDEIFLDINDDLIKELSGSNLSLLEEYKEYVIKDEFLTGNIKKKIDNVDKLLNIINYNINMGNDYQGYKVMLEEYKEKLISVLPERIKAVDIDAKVGANWIPIKYYNDFIWENFTTNLPGNYKYYCEVKYNSYTSNWKIDNKKYENNNTTKYYGTDKITAGELFEDLLNLKASKVMAKRIENGQEISYVDEKETFLAQQKQEEIKFKFKEWIFSDKDRRNELEEIYNNKFNSIVSRNYDGSNLTFSGMNPEVNLREHQKNAIARTLFGGNSLLAHVVGAGKTYEMVASAMESKRIGLASKSMLVVPNHLTEQIGREFLDLYPSANILIATKKDFEPANRKKFTGKIATGDYDAVIIGHTQFEKIPLSKERRMYYIQSEINNLNEIIESSSDKFTTKEIEKAKKKLSTKLLKLIETKEKDDVLNFEDLGIDRLYVDEAHSFKNLYTPTKLSNISGISQTEAMKSSDMYMKCCYMNEKTGYKGVIFATGTAISNTMVEMFTMQRYLQGDKLEELGLTNFDDWIASFGEIKNSMELKPTGTGYQLKTRLSSFSNLPELITIFKECADVKTKEDLDLPIPNANYHTVITKASDEQKDILKTFVSRAEIVKNRAVDPTEDNMLKITNDGKKLALDVRLFNPDLEDLPDSKVNKCVDNVINIYNDTVKDKSTQVIFCDMSTPGKEFNLYDDIREKLINKGVKADEIAFIHDAKNETQKTSMFEKVKKGDIRILLGSTAKMGAGTNIQNKLIALHDLDVPWRPSDLEQRAGRIVRQGNENKEVNIYRYVTENTFDSYLWQTIENKQRFISQVLTSKDIARVSDDVDEVTLDYAEIKALATGNPLIKEKMQVDLDVQKLKMMYSNYNKIIFRLEDDIENKYPREIKHLESSIIKLEQDSKLYLNNSVKNTFIVAGKEYDDLAEAEKTMIKYVKDKAIIKPTKVGEYKGFDVIISHNLAKGVYECKLKGNSEYNVNIAFSKTDVNILRMENKLSLIKDTLEKHKDRLNNVKNTLLEAKEKVKVPFEKKEELKTLLNRQAELNYIINNSTEDKEI